MKTLLGLILIMTLTVGAQAQKREYVRITTEAGVMLIHLYDTTPVHKANFIRLANEGVYDGTTFHRIIPAFMIQGGDPLSKDADPLNDGTGGPKFTGLSYQQRDSDDSTSYTLPAEFRPNLFHKKGVIAAARNGDQVNPEKRSSGSQFYIVEGKKWTLPELASLSARYGTALSEAQKTAYSTIGGTPHLDGAYTVFGEVISGLDVISKISALSRDPSDRPLVDFRMKVEIVKLSDKDLEKKYGVELPMQLLAE